MNLLIDPDTKTWTFNLISKLFTSEVGSSICNIPLSLLGAKNKQTWKPTKNGLFSVKSAYAIEMARGEKITKGIIEPKSQRTILAKGVEAKYPKLCQALFMKSLPRYLAYQGELSQEENN